MDQHESTWASQLHMSTSPKQPVAAASGCSQWLQPCPWVGPPVEIGSCGLKPAHLTHVLRPRTAQRRDVPCALLWVLLVVELLPGVAHEFFEARRDHAEAEVLTRATP